MKRYLVEHGKCDHITEYLILCGYSEAEAENGLEGFVSAWEDIIKEISTSNPYSLDNYDHYTYQRKRTELYLVLQQASPYQKAFFEERVTRADDLFIQCTEEVDRPYDIYTDEINKPDKKIHWWLFRTR